MIRMANWILSFVFAFTSVAFAKVSLKGNEGGGGSCGVKVGESWVLKDFSRAGALAIAIQGTWPNSQLMIGPVGLRLGLELLNGKTGAIDLTTTRAFDLAQKRLAAWHGDSPWLVATLREAMASVRFAAANMYFKPLAFGCQEHDDYPAVIYVPELTLALISIPVWNNLSLESQAGAIVKESLRLLQSEFQDDFFQSEGLTERSEQMLSELVTTLIYGSPIPRGNSLGAIFQRHGLTEPFAQLQNLIDENFQLCSRMAVGVTDLGDSCKTMADAQPNEESLTLILDLNQRLLARLGDQDLVAKRDLTDMQQRVLASRLQMILSNPELPVALKHLRQVTSALEYCAATAASNGMCKINGWQAIEEAAQNIFSGSSDLQTDELIQSFNLKLKKLGRETSTGKGRELLWVN